MTIRDYARHHVRLGYAATEYGNQSDTVDVAIELVSTATTHRGLYVGATRGRDDNRIHVITDSTDLAEARDVLETVLAHERADVPAVTQRRELARQAQPAERRQLEPASIIPGWVGPWRAQLEQRRHDLVGDHADRAERRAEAAAGLAALHPSLAAARAAWKPYGHAVADVEHDLRSELRPAMWKANSDARHPGFGHHHASRRRAKTATGRVADAETRVAAIHADGADVRQQLDRIEADAANLADLAHPTPAAAWLEQLNRDQLDHIDGMLDALAVWTRWAHGRPISVTKLDHAAGILAHAARDAPQFARSPSEIDRGRWNELLASVTRLLPEHCIEPLRDPPAVDLERNGPSIEL
jgi:hypothetical protein